MPSAMSAFEYEGLNYEVLDSDAGTCALSYNPGASGDLVIPAHPVDESGREWTLTLIYKIPLLGVISRPAASTSCRSFFITSA